MAEASCASVVRSARAVVADVGERAASKSAGLLELSNRSERNAERDCRTLLTKKHGLVLPIPQSRLDTGGEGKGEDVPVLRFRDWCNFLVNGNHTHLLVGLQKPDHKREAAILQRFWDKYRYQAPHHPVFTLADNNLLNLGTCVPIAFHGDEGRGRKRGAFLVMSYHSLLGRGVSTTAKGKREYAKLLPNFIGHTLTTRFLFCALPKLMYTGNREYVFDSLLNLVATEAEDLLHKGVTDNLAGRGQFTFAVLSISGDWPFLADSGYMERSYRNVQKHRRQQRVPLGICHLCRSGQLGFDFEELNTDQPRWRPTMHSQDLHGNWDPSPLVRIPHTPGETGSLWSFDLFHCWHLGVGKYFFEQFHRDFVTAPTGGVMWTNGSTVCRAYSWTTARSTTRTPTLPSCRKSLWDGHQQPHTPAEAGTRVLSRQSLWSGWSTVSRQKAMDGQRCTGWQVKLQQQPMISCVWFTASVLLCPEQKVGTQVTCAWHFWESIRFWHALQCQTISVCGFLSPSTMPCTTLHCTCWKDLWRVLFWTRCAGARNNQRISWVGLPDYRGGWHPNFFKWLHVSFPVICSNHTSTGWKLVT